MPEPHATAHAPEPTRTTSDLVFGAIGILAVLLALAFFLVGGPEDGAPAAPPPPPAVAVLEPAAGAVVEGPVSLVFSTEKELGQDASGWVAEGRYHLHAMVGGTELMAAPGQIQPLGGARYRWTLPALPPGEHRVRLQWSGPDHRTLEEGGSPPLTVHVR